MTLITLKKGSKEAGYKEIGKIAKLVYFSLETPPTERDNGV